MAPRDVVLHRQFNWDSAARAVTINYHSIEDDRCPRTPGTVRADSPHSMWRFRSVPCCDYTADVSPTSMEATSMSDPPSVEESDVSVVKRFLGSIKRRFGKPLRLGTFELSVLFARRGLANGKKQEGEPQKVRLGPQGGVAPVHIPKAQYGTRRGPSTKPQVPASKAVEPRQNALQHNLAELACGKAHTRNAGSVRTGQASDKPAKWRGVGTVIEFESFVDSHGSVPTWLINHLQRYALALLRFFVHFYYQHFCYIWSSRSFPAQALSAYRALAEKKIATPYEKVIDW